MTRKLLTFFLVAAAAFAVTVPRQAGEVTIRTPFGQSLLSEYKGKIVVLGFILTTCPHCQETTRILSVIQNEYAPKGVQVLEAAFNADAPQKLAEFIRLYKPTFPVGTVDSNFVQGFAQITPALRATVPILFFIDRTGVIRSQHFGGDALFEGDSNANIRAQLDKLVAEAAPPAAKKSATKSTTTKKK